MEETIPREFLDRTEIRTMRKDLQKLREVDALEERNKIAKMKTIEEEVIIPQSIENTEDQQKIANQQEQIFQRKQADEQAAAIQVKKYATEQEKQQIFLLESQKLELEDKIKEFTNEKEPPLLLEKNKILLEIKDQKEELNRIIEDEKKLESEQKFIEQKEKESNIPQEKKSLEKRRWELEELRENVEKKRWSTEREIKNLDDKTKILEQGYEKFLTEEQQLKNKITEIETSLRAIYSEVIRKEEEKRKNLSDEQKITAEKMAILATKSKETIQRKQWTKNQPQDQEGDTKKIPESFKENLAKESEKEETFRKQFLEEVEKWSKDK